MKLKNLTAFITGAGGGIGRAIAVALAKEGAKLVLFGGNNKEKLNETLSAVTACGGECYVKAGNLTDDKFITENFVAAVEEFGAPDILINNAGATLNSPFESTNIETFDKIMNINARAPYLLTQTALPYLKKSKSASIINIASVVAHQGYVNQSAYSASKHALLGFTKSLAAEVYKDGIRVHAISPGGVYTDMVKISRPDLTAEGMIMPEDIADIVTFILTHRTNAVIDEINVHRANKAPFLI
ncbi:MAG: SDR family oxidoreductase [Clostridiales bacterium]|nr:SDR family oxidoreductase [Clostridiales bacterium]